MIDISAINRVLPAIGIETQELGCIKGRVADRKLYLLLPPVGWTEPAVCIRDMLRFIRSECGYPLDVLDPEAEEVERELLQALTVEQRPLMEAIGVHSSPCASLSAVASAAADLGTAEAEIARAILMFGATLVCQPIIKQSTTEKGESGRAWSLNDLKNGPAEGGYTEPFWNAVSFLPDEFMNDEHYANSVASWLQDIADDINALEQVTQRSILEIYEEPPTFYRREYITHRYLLLDFLCFVAPDIEFVQYLLGVSGAPTVDALRSALRSTETFRASPPMWRWPPDYEIYELRIDLITLLAD